MACPATGNNFVLATQICFGIGAALSIVLSLVIIIFYFCLNKFWEKKRNNNINAVDEDKRLIKKPIRYIICSIAVANILGGITHIWGVSTKYEIETIKSNITFAEAQCGAQAMLAIFSVLSSFAWISFLACYSVFILRVSPEYTKNLRLPQAFVVYNMFCWGIPFIITFGLAAGNALGFQMGVDVGWCYVHLEKPKESHNKAVLLFSYEIWALLSIVVTTIAGICYAICHCQKNSENYAPLQGGEEACEEEFSCCCPTNKCTTGLTLLLAAVALLVMRIPSSVLDLILIRLSFDEREKFICTGGYAFLVFVAGIGDTVQGIANFFLFVCPKLCYYCCSKKQNN